jgi:hypothetical protein
VSVCIASERAREGYVRHRKYEEECSAVCDRDGTKGEEERERTKVAKVRARDAKGRQVARGSTGLGGRRWRRGW